MNSVRNMLFSAIVASAGVSLSACGGGSSAPAPTPAPTGVCNTMQSIVRHVVGPDGKTLAIRAALPEGKLPLYDPQRIVVGFAPSAYRADEAAKIDAQVSAIGATPLGLTNSLGFQVFTVPQGRDTHRAMAAMRALPGVRSVSYDSYRYALSVPNDPTMQNDYQQWDMYQINMPSAWNLSTGDPAVKIAIIDTGVDLTNGDVATKVVGQKVFVAGAPSNATVQDNDGHGTNVSGIAAADTNNGLDVAGVGYNVNLVEARVFGHPTQACPSPSAYASDIANAILWAVSQNANVINLSLGSPSADPNEESAVATALAQGVSVVAAAGNDGTNTVDFPAADPGVIAVGATVLQDITPNDPTGAVEVVAGYSNFGPQLAVVAPGGGPTQAQISACSQSFANCDYLQWIFNLYSQTAFSGPGVSEALFAGTSQASPHVAGLVALMKSKALADGKPLTPATARQLIINHAANIGDPHQGAGRIDAQATLNDPQI
jgi:subtilase family protein/fervidolysin-like protein